jgi:hypothetical protein
MKTCWAIVITGAMSAALQAWAGEPPTLLPVGARPPKPVGMVAARRPDPRLSPSARLLLLPSWEWAMPLSTRVPSAHSGLTAAELEKAERTRPTLRPPADEGVLTKARESKAPATARGREGRVP